MKRLAFFRTAGVLFATAFLFSPGLGAAGKAGKAKAPAAAPAENPAPAEDPAPAENPAPADNPEPGETPAPADGPEQPTAGVQPAETPAPVPAMKDGQTMDVSGGLVSENGRPALKGADGKIIAIHENLSLSKAEVTKDSQVAMQAKVYEYRGEKFYLLQGPPAENDPALIPEGTKLDIQGDVTIGKGRPWIRVTTPGPYANKEFTILENKALEDWENGNQVNAETKKAAANPEAAADNQPGAVYEEFTSYGTYKVTGRFCGTVTQHYGKNYFLIEPCPAPKKKGGGKGGHHGKGGHKGGKGGGGGGY